jgi:BirA family biotin operon repressor/biotin-[acetyl-CoA-carboxylase] ligase
MYDENSLNDLRQSHPDLLIEYVESIASTQAAVKTNSLLLSNHQTAGVGRRGNSWLSPLGRSISFSYRFELPLSPKDMSGYQMTSALAVIQAMTTFEQPISAKVKWPNDLYFDNKKFAGVLINLKPNTQKSIDVVLGMGINWNLSVDELNSVDQVVCNIPLQNKPSRLQFLNQLIHQIKHNNQLFISKGINGFLNSWQAHDALSNQHINVMNQQQIITGRYLGIDPAGQLMIESAGQIMHFSSGEVSVRII